MDPARERVGDRDLRRGPSVRRRGARSCRECERRLAEVAEPPTDRIRPAFDRAKDACPLLALAGIVHRAEDSRGRRRHPGAVAPFRAGHRADRRRHATSRADLTLSVQASRRVGDPVEVRCWSSPIGSGSWGSEMPGTTPPKRGRAVRLGRHRRGHDRPRHRSVQSARQLAEEDLLGWQRDDQIDAADRRHVRPRDPALRAAGCRRGRGGVRGTPDAGSRRPSAWSDPAEADVSGALHQRHSPRPRRRVSEQHRVRGVGPSPTSQGGARRRAGSAPGGEELAGSSGPGVPAAPAPRPGTARVGSGRCTRDRCRHSRSAEGRAGPRSVPAGGDDDDLPRSDAANVVQAR